MSIYHKHLNQRHFVTFGALKSIFIQADPARGAHDCHQASSRLGRGIPPYSRSLSMPSEVWRLSSAALTPYLTPLVFHPRCLRWLEPSSPAQSSTSPQLCLLDLPMVTYRKIQHSMQVF